MKIDSKRENPLTNFHGLNRNQKIIESDHNKMELILNIQVPVIIQRREEVFNFRDTDGQYLFHNMTNNSSKLRNSFKSGSSFEDQSSQFQKTLQGVFHQTFQKVRGTKRKPMPTELDLLMNERKKVKLYLEGKTKKNINYL